MFHLRQKRSQRRSMKNPTSSVECGTSLARENRRDKDWARRTCVRPSATRALTLLVSRRGEVNPSRSGHLSAPRELCG